MTFHNRALLILWALIVFSHSSCSRSYTEEIRPTVYVEKTADGYRMIRNGEPFFIKGSSGSSFFPELKKAGANTVRIYDTTDLKCKLDLAKRLDLAVIVDIPVPRYYTPDTVYEDEEVMTKHYEATRTFVSKYKDHPALLYWILGNEIKYPDFPVGKNFKENYNALVDLVHDIDKNHPVSTAVGGFDRSKLLAINAWTSLDFMSINIFGELSTFAQRKRNIGLFWRGPYVFTEFGINGPWEADKTTWGAPIEPTSSKKAEQFRERYNDYIDTINDGRFLGYVTFYWGQKLERTPTWFSTNFPDSTKTQVAFEFERLWKGSLDEFNGPEIDYLLLNGRGVNQSLILESGHKASAKLRLLNENYEDYFETKWEIRPENWNYINYEKESLPVSLDDLLWIRGRTSASFHAPKQEGPYRLYVYIKSQNGYIATANIPFYVLNSAYGS